MESASSSSLWFYVLLGVIPFAFLCTTSFLKISVVFSILKNALGAGGDVPSGSVIFALSAILTLYVMAPVGYEIVRVAGPSAAQVNTADPMSDQAALTSTWEAGIEPLRAFLNRNTSPRERDLFFELARDARPEDQRAAITNTDLLILVPAFVVTELSEAFQIGFLVFIPFLIIDLVIANVLMALGMQTLNPTQVSMPFKLLLFVLVDGWYLLARALVLGYA